MPKVSLQLNFSHTNLPISANRQKDHLSDVNHCICGRQTTYSRTIRPLDCDRRSQPGWAEDLNTCDRRCLPRSKCDERSPRRIAGPSCRADRIARVGKWMRWGGWAASPTRHTFTFHTGSYDASFRWLSLHAALRNTEGQFSVTAPRKTVRTLQNTAVAVLVWW